MSLSPCKSMSISELISELRDSFLSRDFERVEQVLVEREAKLRAELEEKKRENGCLKEKIFFERLAKINAELTLKSLMEKGLVKSDDNSNEFGLGGGGGIIVKSEKCMVEVENGKVGFLEEKEIGFGGGLEGKEVVAGIISNDGGIGAAALGELEIKNVINIEDGDEDEFNSQVSLDKKEAKNSCTIGINNDHKSSSSGAHQKNLLTGLAEGIGNLKRKFISSRELNANINVLDGLVLYKTVSKYSKSSTMDKSSLISCILGEVPKISGTLKMCGTKAYVSQSPWIQGGKIEENILFGKEMDREKYEKVLEACSLTKDLEVLPFGDKTIIGEKGINLSGGQKQRVQIARALYQDADIYLFDDPFSAVDAHTGSHLFKECLLGLLKSKTVIYITHQVEFLPDADLILVMRDGRITQSGKYNDIIRSGTDFLELVDAHRAALSSIKSLERRPTSFKTSSITKEDSNSLSDFEHEQTVENVYDQNDKSDDTVEPKGQLVQEEEREKGRVGIKLYWKYITTAYGGALVPFILFSQTLTVGFQIASNYWMTVATPVSETAEPDIGSLTLMVVYVALAIGSSIFTFARAFLAVIAGYKTATVLFNKMHLCIFQAPISFFDATPSGRILNRASTDQSALDMYISNTIWAITLNVFQLLGNITVMSQAVWQVFIILIPVMAACIWYQRYYSASARELARLIGTCQAPVIQHFSETISGSTTIRSFEQESRFNDINMKLIDRYSQPKLYSATAMEWLNIRLDILSTLTFAFCLVFLISFPNSMTAPGIAGLAVTYGLNLNALQAKMIWFICDLENKIISVERILQYTSLPSEPPLVIKDNEPDYSWPSSGEVHIRDLQVRYAPHLPIVLRGLTCTFTAGAKTGIVGRTGSGKTTLVQTLFRLIEPVSGKILIDSINISMIGLHDLRSRLSIIPQDPTMFEGTVRTNLDPLEEYTDQQIWEALDMCQLGDEVRKKEGNLDSIVTENGENWSMGQRQLVCLGRVLLKKSKILVLDEATASVDTATDNIIQQTVKQYFSECTVITIAHRITSIIDSDMVLFLNQGLIEEYDSPKKLLKNKYSSLAQLVAEYTRRSNSGFGN